MIHRDIKAANLLVTPDGTPKLLDFGIAKIVDPSLAGSHAATMMRAMTPDSASPEQVRGESITIAADVYALGVLLYRLLTHQSPYGSAPRSEAALVRAICEQVPERPSAAQRRAGATARTEIVDGDLDQIVLKALRKEPERRYGSVEQFADDLERYLNGRPVLAAPDSQRYRAHKFFQRHRVSVVAGVLAGIAIVAGAAVAVYQGTVAASERARAEQRLAEVRRLANSFMFEFHDAIADLPGALAARQLVVKRAAEHLDGLARDAEHDVALQRELATANMRLGEILGGGGVSNLGDLKGAEARYATALAIRTNLAARPDREFADIEGLAQLHVQLSRFAGVTGDYERAEQHARAAVAALQAPMSEAESARSAGHLATVYQQLGFVEARRGKTADALTSFEAARARAQTSVDSHPGDPLHAARLARIHTDYAEQLVQSGRADEAIEMLADAERRLEQLLASDAHNTRHQLNLLYIFNTMGAAHTLQGNHDSAVAALTRALALAEELVAAQPSDLGSWVGVLQTRYGLGTGLIRAGDTAAGAARLRDAIAAGERMLKIAPAHDFARHQVASARLELGEVPAGHGSAERGSLP